MKYLIKLNRFNLDKSKLLKKLGNPEILEDSEDLLIESKEIKPNFQEINSIYELFENWRKLDFRDLKKSCLAICKNKNIKDYSIKIKFLEKIKISAKSIYKHINPYLKFENINYNENSENIIYIELKKDKEIFYRLFYTKIENKNIKTKYPFTIILENPSLSSEISDFFRLCYIFKMPLIILTKNNIELQVLKAKKETKGIEYDKFNLKIISEIPKDLVLVGFTKYAEKNERDLIEVIKKDNLALVFGDDKYGLTQEVRDKLNYSVRLTPENKKPLRASHALSYVLGIYTSKEIN